MSFYSTFNTQREPSKTLQMHKYPDRRLTNYRYISILHLHCKVASAFPRTEKCNVNQIKEEGIWFVAIFGTLHLTLTWALHPLNELGSNGIRVSYGTCIWMRIWCASNTDSKRMKLLFGTFWNASFLRLFGNKLVNSSESIHSQKQTRWDYLSCVSCVIPQCIRYACAYCVVIWQYARIPPDCENV